MDKTSNKVRHQLSLYVPPECSQSIEQVRAIVDPIQHRLIPAHVTLCREDELSDFASLNNKLANLPFPPLQLGFGNPVAFSSHGWWLECKTGEASFQALRAYILGTTAIRQQSPHLTLAHPRNPRASGNHPASFACLPPALTITFPMLYYIEQVNDEPWQILAQYVFAG